MQPLAELVDTAESDIDAATDLAALDAVRVSYLGKKGAAHGTIERSRASLSAAEQAGSWDRKSIAPSSALQEQLNIRRELTWRTPGPGRESSQRMRSTLHCQVVARNWVAATPSCVR